MYIMKNWAIIYNPDYTVFTAPELITQKLYGKVYNHNKYKDGDKIITSSIIEISGKYITTSSGSVYKLEGEPLQEWKEFCQENGYKESFEKFMQNVGVLNE